MEEHEDINTWIISVFTLKDYHSWVQVLDSLENPSAISAVTFHAKESYDLARTNT